MRIWLLGAFKVSVGSRTIEEEIWRLTKAASLVKLLALSPTHRLHREQIMDALWPDLGTGRASNNLRGALHAARRTLEPGRTANSRYLSLREKQLTLCPGERLWVDIEAFEEAAGAARRSRDPSAFKLAIELYAGELLPGDRYEEWTEGRREELRRLYLGLLLELAGLHEERDEHEPAVQVLLRGVAEDPTLEEAHAGLMRLYALSGRHTLALAQYERLRKVLSEKLEMEPGPSTRSLYEEIAAGRFPSGESTAPAAKKPKVEGKHNLPAPRSSFVGRESELRNLKRDLAMTRLLTLTGAGGCGKTRLGLEAARELAGAYPDGVWLVELAPLSEGTLVAHAVATALGHPEQPDRSITDTLVDFLRAKRALLVLDNCEHLLDSVARLTDTLLNSCSHLKVLATSRESLNVEGELTWLVPSLSAPGRERTQGVEELAGYDSVRLFVERAGRRSPSFALTPENSLALARICSRLEGIPLAIELAAARVGLSAEEIAARLDDSLGLLTTGSRTASPRQQTLRGTLDWSYELLSEPERSLFGRLSVFAGGWTLEAAENVGTEGDTERGEILDLLSRLVEKSLVVAEAAGGGRVRYRLLEPVRQYGQERLEAGGSEEAKSIRERHMRYYLALAEAAEPELMGANQASRLERLAIEHANIRAALSWAMDPEGARPEERGESGLRLAAALGRFWRAHGLSEGLVWLERGLARGRESPLSVRAKALEEAGYLAIWLGNYEKAVAMLEEGLTSFKRLEDKSSVATLLADLGVAMAHRCDHERVRAMRREAEALLPELADGPAIALVLNFLGMAAMDEGDHARAVARFEESLSLYRDLGDTRGIAVNLISLGMTELSRNDCDRAEAPLKEVLRLLQGQGDKVALAYGLLGLGGVAASRGLPDRAARLWGASEALREADGLTLSPFTRANYDYEGDVATARSGLDEQSFTAAWATGREMTIEQATEYALSGEERPTPTLVLVPGQPPTERLTPREQEVALLVGQGLTNRQIAQELVLSEHTVHHHITNILKKLNLTSRQQVDSRLRDKTLRGGLPH